MPQLSGGPSSEPITKVEAPLPVVDYMVVSPTRGPKPPETGPETLVLQGKRLRLRIHLPLGSVAGEYEVRLHQKVDKKEVMKAYRNAAQREQQHPRYRRRLR